MFPSKTPYFPFKPSVDRIDNSKPHTSDNCILVCMAENYARNDMDQNEFIEWINKNFNQL